MKDTYFKTTKYGVSSDIEKLKAEIEKIWIEIKAIKKKLEENENSVHVKPESTPHSK